MSDDKRKILEMIGAGTITPEEGEKLLDALSRSDERKDEAESPDFKNKSLYIDVRSKNKEENKEKVHIRIPFPLLKAGINIMALIPKEAKENIDSKLKEKNIDFNLNNLSDGNVQDFIKAVEDVSIEVEDEDDFIQIYCR